MRKEKYYSSKMPLSLVLLFLLNIILVVSFQLLFRYTLPANADETALSKHDPAFSGSAILSQDSYSMDLNAYLLELPDGSHMLVTTKPHPIIFGRAKLISAQQVDLSIPQDQVFYIKNGIHTSEVIVSANNTVTISYGYGGGMNETLALYMVLAAAMEGAELLAYYFIKKNLQ